MTGAARKGISSFFDDGRKMYNSINKIQMLFMHQNVTPGNTLALVLGSPAINSVNINSRQEADAESNVTNTLRKQRDYRISKHFLWILCKP